MERGIVKWPQVGAVTAKEKERLLIRADIYAENGLSFKVSVYKI